MSSTALDEEFAWRGRTVRWGSRGSGPALVFLHGTPWSSELWRPIAESLAHHFTVYLWDMPGYGRSSMDPSHPVDLGEQGELFADLLDHWGLSRPHVIAHDFGGAVALRARLLHGAEYASLCLVDIVALSPWGSPFFTLVKEHAAVFEQVPSAVHRGALEAYIGGASHRGLRPEDLRMLVDPWCTPAGRPAFYRQIAQADERFTDEVEAAYGDISEPVHIVWGEEDTWIPLDRARRLRDAIPHASLTVIPGAGHLIQLDAPEALSVDLAEWLAAVEPSGPGYARTAPTGENRHG
ncbi:alpha/beta fold hydrolase [Microbacterium indicum]|uniref:alpha/beta fold hydrolase n=1 Tax=Microbacterium indicum TaxID=358100 RepID=UPI0003FD3367|nr:alpha/beta fold hydrolase [Microbacterium indicum]